MKLLAVSLLGLISSVAFAQIEVSQLSTNAHQVTQIMEHNNVTEAGFQMSSINNGSAFASLSVAHEFDNGFDLGIRGLLPMEYSKQAQAYMGQIYGRFMLVNDINQMYIEINGTQGFFNAPEGTDAFNMIGAGYSYTRHLTAQFAASALIGVDYSGTRLSHDEVISSSPTFYNHIGVSGSYFF